MLMIAIGISLVKIESANAQVSVSFQVFYDRLSPYGSWVSYPGHGYAWLPRAGLGFRPYVSNGHWVYTDSGWMWVSNYDWGWAPFHYGSWVNDDAYGWLWIPGYDWAPAWVEWGSVDGYYGWAPLGPGFSIGVGYYPPIEHWCFVHPRYMASADWSNHYYIAHDHRISISNNTTITNINRVTIVNNRNNFNNRQYYSGPQRQEIENAGHTTIRPVAIRESNAPGKTEVNNSALTVYRPRVDRSANNTAAKPAKVQTLDRSKVIQSSTSAVPANRADKNQAKPATTTQGRNQTPIQKPSGNNTTRNPINRSAPVVHQQKSLDQQQKLNRTPQGHNQPASPQKKMNPGQPAPELKQQTAPQQHNSIKPNVARPNKMPPKQMQQPAPERKEMQMNQPAHEPERGHEKR